MHTAMLRVWHRYNDTSLKNSTLNVKVFDYVNETMDTKSAEVFLKLMNKGFASQPTRDDIGFLFGLMKRYAAAASSTRRSCEISRAQFAKLYSIAMH